MNCPLCDRTDKHSHTVGEYMEADVGIPVPGFIARGFLSGEEEAQWHERREQPMRWLRRNTVRGPFGTRWQIPPPVPSRDLPNQWASIKFPHDNAQRTFETRLMEIMWRLDEFPPAGDGCTCEQDRTNVTVMPDCPHHAFALWEAAEHAGIDLPTSWPEIQGPVREDVSDD